MKEDKKEQFKRKLRTMKLEELEKMESKIKSATGKTLMTAILNEKRQASDWDLVFDEKEKG